jgi:hypothetical protein
MSFKEQIVKAVDNVKDGVSEAGHKAEAQGEQAKRDIAGDSMTPTEKAGSMLNQAKNDVQAGVDSAKQDARNNT